MASNFDKLQETLAGEHANGLPGVVLVAFDDKDIIFSQALGKAKSSSDEPISLDSTFWAFSCTKLFTTICALQCVERGLIGIDDEVHGVLVELANPDVISPSADDEQFKLAPAQNKITLRHLLTHTSGLSYDAMQPLLTAWRKSRGEPPMVMSGKVVEAYSLPLMFEPGSSWVYGSSLDWAGVMVERLNGGIRLSEYMEQNIFKPLGLNGSTFHLKARPELKERIIEMVARTPAGSLSSMTSPYPEDAQDDSGGMGMVTSTSDFLKVLMDLLRDDPVLLKKETRDEMFKPQFEVDSPQYKGFVAQAALHKQLTGNTSGDPKIVFGLGGLVTQGEVPNLPVNTLSWNGMPNIGWSINRETKAGALYVSQVMPPSDPKSVQLLATFWKGFWGRP